MKTSPRVSKNIGINTGYGYEVELDINGKTYRYEFFSEEYFNMYWRMRNKGKMLNQIKPFLIMPEQKNYIVQYGIQDGENYYTKHTLITAEPEKFDDEVDRFFTDFWGEDTYKEDGRYWSSDGTLCVRMETSQEIPDEDLTVIKKYISL